MYSRCDAALSVARCHDDAHVALLAPIRTPSVLDDPIGTRHRIHPITGDENHVVYGPRAIAVVDSASIALKKTERKRGGKRGETDGEQRWTA